jgi:probable F420-dependent oxidoreductase
MKTSVSLGPATFGISAFEEFCTAGAIVEIARAAEGAGFDAVFVTEHPIPHPETYAVGAHDAPDPFVTLAIAAGATTRLRLHTHVVVLPYRNPFLLAKAVATLDFASQGRVILGVGAGYLPSEFDALGADFAERNEVVDESISAMRAVWSGEPVHVEGRGFRAYGHLSQPLPVQRPHPPIWIGGNSKRAIRRAVELGQAWVPFPNPPGAARVGRTASLLSLEEMAPRIAYLRGYAEEIGRVAPIDIAFTPQFSSAWEDREPSADEVIDDARRLHALGVTYLVAGIGARTRAEFLQRLAAYAADILDETNRI